MTNYEWKVRVRLEDASVEEYVEIGESQSEVARAALMFATEASGQRGWIISVRRVELKEKGE